MEITVTENDMFTRLGIMGHFFDQNDFETLKRNVEKQISESKNVVIDISRLTFLSSRGLGTFITLSRLCQEKNLDLVLYCPREEILDTIEVSGINLVVDVTDNEDYIVKKYNL